jgi:hypothetical protein
MGSFRLARGFSPDSLPDRGAALLLDPKIG